MTLRKTVLGPVRPSESRPSLQWFLAFLFLCFASVLRAEDAPEKLVDLEPFSRFDVKATGYAENQQSQFGADQVATQIESIIRSKVKEWNVQRPVRPARTLDIQPYIARIRLKTGSVLPRSPQIVLRLRFTDAQSGEVIAAPEFSGQVKALAATFSGGSADNEMLTRVAREAADYLDKCHDASIAAAKQRRAEGVAKERTAAEGGSASAQTLLGLRYSIGQDVERDATQAAYWWRKAADQGDASAQFHLGEAYASGNGVEHDDVQAALWFRKSADQGDNQSTRALASLYESGRGVPHDEKVALALYQKAADRGDLSAKRYLVRKSRDTARFSSFEDAQNVLAPEAGYDVQLVMDPMGLRGKILALRLTVLQVIGDNELLLTSPFGDALGGRTFFGYLPSNYTGRRDFVDNQDVSVVGEVIGTYQYVANSGARKTVPKMRIYGIRAGLP